MRRASPVRRSCGRHRNCRLWGCRNTCLQASLQLRRRSSPSANWSVPLTLSAMDLAMSSGFLGEFCGVPDFPTEERAVPHMTRRVATRKRLIPTSTIQERIRKPRREVERAGSWVGRFGRGRTIPSVEREIVERHGGRWLRSLVIAASRTRLWLGQDRDVDLVARLRCGTTFSQSRTVGISFDSVSISAT